MYLPACLEAHGALKVHVHLVPYVALSSYLKYFVQRMEKV